MIKRICTFAGTVAVLVAFGAVSPAQASFPGANGKIAASGCGPEDCGLFVFNPDGSGLAQITHNPYRGFSRICGCYEPLFDLEPAWSADGTKVAFIRVADVGDTKIWVANADGSDAHSLGVNGHDPAWSPDGTKIAFWAFGGPQGSNGIFVMNPDGSGVTRLLQGRDPRFPDWSPDGTKLAFRDSREEGFHDPEIFVANADGTNPTSLTPPDFRSGIRWANGQPSWSPDGSRIAFSAGSPSPSVDPDIYAIRADGSGRVKLSVSSPGRTIASNPSWSPDGNQILYDRHGFYGSELVVMDANGANPRVLRGGSDAAWQPIPPPSRSDYKNAAQFCKAVHDFFGDEDFTKKYGANGNGANAYGKCVSQSQ